MSHEDQPLFRQEALDHANLEKHLNERLNIVALSSWIILCAVILVLVTVVLYGFLGSIPTRVPGSGILLASKGSLYNAVAPEGNGRIISLAVKPGDTVSKNQSYCQIWCTASGGLPV